MIKPRDLDRAQHLMKQLSEVSWRADRLSKRGHSWDEEMRITIGLEPLFGNDRDWPNATELEFSDEYRQAASSIAATILAYLENEEQRIRKELVALGVKFEGE